MSSVLIFLVEEEREVVLCGEVRPARCCPDVV